jgi:hypothetical protein
MAINPSGTVTGIYVGVGGVVHGFLRTEDGTVTTFDAPSARTLGTIATAINPDGTVTGYFLTPSHVLHGFVRAADGTITTFDAPGAGALRESGTVGLAINPAGTVTGYYTDGVSAVPHGFVRIADGTITTFDVPSSGSQQTVGSAINPDGTVTGQSADADGVSHGFVRTSDGTITTFDPPGGVHASDINPTAINPVGTIAGTYIDEDDVIPGGDAIRGFLRAKDGTITTFDVPSSAPYFTAPVAINPAGTVTGYYSDGTREHGFIRTSNGTITTLDAPDALGSAATVRISTSPFAMRRGGAPAATAGVRLMSVTRAGSTALLEYSLPSASEISLAAYNVAGRRVEMLEQGPQSAGAHQVMWDAKGVASGIYFIRLQAGSTTVTKSVRILR